MLEGSEIWKPIAQLKMVSVSSLYFLEIHNMFWCEERFYPQTLYMLHIYKQPTEYISKTCFLNSKMLNKFYACPSINKSTEQYPRIPYYSLPLFPTIASHCLLMQLALQPEPTNRATRDTQKAAQYIFPLWKEDPQYHKVNVSRCGRGEGWGLTRIKTT